MADQTVAYPGNLITKMKDMGDGTWAPLIATMPSGSGATAGQVQGNVAGGATDSGNPVKIAGVFNTTPPTYATGQRAELQADSRGSLATVDTPTAGAAGALTVQSTAAVASALVLKAAAGNLYGYNIVTGASAGYLMIFDATTAPADGAVTPKLCIAVAANASVDRAFGKPLRFTTGIVLAFSTTGPFTKTASATAFLAGESV